VGLEERRVWDGGGICLGGGHLAMVSQLALIRFLPRSQRTEIKCQELIQ